MHELAVCQGLMLEIERVAARNDASAVMEVTVLIGALSGVEPPLLQSAFTIARAGTIAQNATLEIEFMPPKVLCTSCGATTEASPNRLVCGSCGDWRVRVIEGDEMLLKSVELERAAPINAATTSELNA